MRLLHEDLTFAVRGCIFDVHNQLKTGLDEESYHLALERRLKKSNIEFQSKPSFILEHRGKLVHKFIPDLVVADRLILELKNIRTEFTTANHLQILSYLKFSKKELGLLVNFGLLKAKIKRIPFFEKELILFEDYSAIENLIHADDEAYFDVARTAILNIFHIHGLSYDYPIYQKLFQVELAYLEIPFISSVLFPVEFDNQLLRKVELKMPLIADKIFCLITAGQPDLLVQKATMRNYLTKMNIPIGLIANFGKDKLEIIGISQ